MQNYLDGALLEAIERGRKLKEKIPHETLAVSFNPLVQTCENLIDSILFELNDAIKNGELNHKLFTLRDSIHRLDLIENRPVAALSRIDQNDEFINKIIDKIRREIKYPITPPVGLCFSQPFHYFYYEPFFNILSVPLLEVDFLLHLPDIYHELGHPLLFTTNNPKIEGLQKSLGQFNYQVYNYYKDEITRETRAGNTNIVVALNNWRDNWIKSWSIELFCDLFATFTLGPAFVWSHLHLCAKRGSDPFSVQLYQLIDHPADQVRMLSMLFALELIGFNKAKVTIENKWDEFVRLGKSKTIPEFNRAYPTDLIQLVTALAHQGTKSLNCIFASSNCKDDSIQFILNNAWDTFWENPREYINWEKQQILTLRQTK
ncbi:MAG: hypothetical protein IPM14_05085 [bacterium]|nr:hypothetical protein [bacterium]